MSKVIDMAGWKIGKLRMNYPVGVKADKRSRTFYWNATCDCGNTVDVNGSNVRKGRTTHCGCEIGLPGDEASFRIIYRDYQRSAVKKNREFALTYDQVRDLTSKPCYYCGSLPSSKQPSNTGKTKAIYVYNGIDRIDNDRGYLIDNVVSCCATCNFMKHTLSMDVFLEHIRKIIAHQESKDA